MLIVIPKYRVCGKVFKHWRSILLARAKILMGRRISDGWYVERDTILLMIEGVHREPDADGMKEQCSEPRSMGLTKATESGAVLQGGELVGKGIHLRKDIDWR